MSAETDDDPLGDLEPSALLEQWRKQSWADESSARTTRRFDPGPNWIPDAGINFDAPPKVTVKDMSPEILHAAGLRTADEVVSDVLSIGGSAPSGAISNEPFKKLPGANL